MVTTRTSKAKPRAPRAPASPVREAAKPALAPAAAKSPKAKAKAQQAAPQPPSAPKVDKPAKAPRKPKPVLVRDGFTMPEADFALIAQLKARSMAGGREAKKSELLRAGLQALAALEGAALVAALNRLEPVKVGRPKKGH